MEGPSLVILKEELKPFVGKKVLRVSGNTREPKETLRGLSLKRVHIWGKVLFLEFSKGKGAPSVWTRTHFMMFGSYRIDDPKPDRVPRLKLEFPNGVFETYACSFRFTDRDAFAALDRRVDMLAQQWDEGHVLRLLATKKEIFLCDLLLDQGIFAGSGNIVKNEVLFNLRRHPLTTLGEIRCADWPLVIRAVRNYCEHFYEWKKRFELRRHWQVYRKYRCPLCDGKLKREKLGCLERSTFYCEVHQIRPGRGRKLVAHEVLPPSAPAAAKEKRLDH